MSDDRAQAFHEAIMAGDQPEVERLAGTRPGLLDASRGEVSPVLLALFHGHEPLAHALAKLGATLGPSEAAALGSTDALERSLTEATQEAGSAGRRALARPGPTGWTPLHLAAFLGRVDATRWLLEHGADPAAPSATAEANTALHAALAGRGEREVVRTLLAHGADPAARAAGGVTPLHLAASRGDGEAVDALLDAGARPDLLEDGRPPSALAAERGHPTLAARLRALEAGSTADA